jgi:hypothetical protein
LSTLYSTACSLQFETEAEGSRLRRDVTVASGLAPLGGGEAGKKMMDAQLSGREEQFAFKRAVSPHLIKSI